MGDVMVATSTLYIVAASHSRACCIVLCEANGIVVLQNKHHAVLKNALKQ